MIALPQLLAIIIAIVILYYSHLIYKKKVFNRFEFIFWIFVWGSLMIISIFSSFIVSLSNSIIFYRLLDIILVISIIVLFGIIFRLHKKINENEIKIKELVRKITYMQVDSEQK
jgi:hypothetical protein